MASLHDVYGTPEFTSQMQNPFVGDHTSGDSTPMTVALMLLFWGGVLYLLKRYGFRFNFGVAGGK